VFYHPSFNTGVQEKIDKKLKSLSTPNTVSLTTTSTLSTHFDPVTWNVKSLIMNGDVMTTDRANGVLSETLMAPERADYRDQYYSRVIPSHRVALWNWWERTVLLPFGASDDHLTTMNRWMFLPDGRLALGNEVNPIRGWEYV
jgi:hypothetical protein